MSEQQRAITGLPRYQSRRAARRLMRAASAEDRQQDQQYTAQREAEQPTVEQPGVEPVTAQRTVPTPAEAKAASQMSTVLPEVSGETAPRKQRQQFHAERKRAERTARWEARSGDPIAQLKADSLKAEKALMKSLRRSHILDKGMSPPKQAQELSEFNKAYVGMMVMSMVGPLQRGVNVQNVSTTVGMGTTMFLLSPNFRQMTTEYAQDAREFVAKKSSEMAQNKLDKRFDKHGDKAHKGIRGLRGKILQRRVDRYDKMQRGHREVFTERSAAMTEIGLTENAYWSMREPGKTPEDIADIKKRYDTAMGKLYEYVEQDGVDVGEMSQHMRVIVGQRMETEPTLGHVFAETGQGRFVKSEPVDVYVAGTDKKVKAWTGDYYDTHTGEPVQTGSFTLRMPQTEEQHMHTMAETMWGDMADAQTVGEFNDVMEGYIVGTATLKNAEAVDLIEDPISRSRMERARTMFASMESDGIPDYRRYEVYKAALTGAIAEAQQQAPELAAAWNSEYGGEEWPKNTEAHMDAFVELGKDSASRPSREALAEQLGSYLDGDDIEAAEAEDDTVEQTAVADYEAQPAPEGQIDDVAAAMSLPDEPWVTTALEQSQIALEDHLADGFVQDGPEGFVKAIEQAQLAGSAAASPKQGGLAKRLRKITAGVHQQAQVESSDMEAASLIYSHAGRQTIESVVANQPELEEYMIGTYGVNWAADQQQRMSAPDSYVAPGIPEGIAAEDRDRILINSMSASMTGDTLLAQQQAGKSFGGAKKVGAMSMVLEEYTTGDATAGVEDAEYSLRQARMEQMRQAMGQAGVTDPAQQQQLFATAVTHAAEKVTDRTMLGSVAVKNVYGAGNWQQKAFQRTAGLDTATAAEQEMYDARKLRLGLTGIDTSYVKAEFNIGSAVVDTLKDTAAETAITTRRQLKARRARVALQDNVYHNEVRELRSGRRYEEQQTQSAPLELE